MLTSMGSSLRSGYERERIAWRQATGMPFWLEVVHEISTVELTL